MVRQETRESLQTHIQDKQPEEYQRYPTGINQVLKLSWEIVNTSNKRYNTNEDSNGNNQRPLIATKDYKTRPQDLSP
jgi:hypothetical protein